MCYTATMLMVRIGKIFRDGAIGCWKSKMMFSFSGMSF